MLSNRTSRWSIGAALLCIALLAASWFLLVSPRRADASTVRAQTATVESKATALQLQIAQLKVEFADLPKRRAQLKAIKAQLPSKENIPALVRQLQKLSDDTGITLDSIAPGQPTVLTAPGAVAAATAGPGAVVTIPMTIDITGDYFEASLFVKNLQTKVKRSFLISSINVTGAQSEDPTTTTTTSTTSADNSTTPPTATPTVSPTTTATPTSTPTITPSLTPTTIDNPLQQASLTITGSVFVLLDGTSTLQSVAKAAKAATAGQGAAGATPTTSPTAG